VLFNAIVVMAHALGMRVVAEGVESLDQLRALQGLGCDEVQGFYISRPVPAAELPALMRQDCLFPVLRAGLRLVSGD
jgi:EAL domain-containing protein (putative c-di-GMP-specific phosphodiesterase class I)